MSDQTDNTRRSDSPGDRAPDKQDGSVANRSERGELAPRDGAGPGGAKADGTPEAADNRLPDRAPAGGADATKVSEARPELGGIAKIAERALGDTSEKAPLSPTADHLARADTAMKDGKTDVAASEVLQAQLSFVKAVLEVAGIPDSPEFEDPDAGIPDTPEFEDPDDAPVPEPFEPGRDGPRELSPSEELRIAERMVELEESGDNWEIKPDGSVGYTAEYAELRHQLQDSIRARADRELESHSPEQGQRDDDPNGHGRSDVGPDAPDIRDDQGPVERADAALGEAETRMAGLEANGQKYEDNTLSPEFVRALARGDTETMDRLEAEGRMVADDTLTPEYEQAESDYEDAFWEKWEAIQDMSERLDTVRADL